MAGVKKVSNLITTRLSRCIYNFSRSSSTDRSFKFSDLKIKAVSKAQEKNKPDLSNLSFGQVFSDHMFEAEWNQKTGWGVPKIIPLHNFVLHPASKIFHYAQAVFEGMKAFKSSDGSVRLFRPHMNIQRLLESAERATLPTFDGDDFFKCLKKLVSMDKGWIPNGAACSLYIRPTFIGTQNSLGVHTANTALLYIITSPVGPYFPSGQAKAISLLADPSYVRAWPGGVGNKKLASNYAPTLYVQKLAEEQGLQQVLWLIGDNQQIAEVGAMNVFFFIQKGSNEFELVTPALDGTILPGVTRQSLLDLAKKFNEFTVSERTITMSEILAENEKQTLLEVFVCGTAVSVCPVESIRYLNRDINVPTMSRENPLYHRLYKALTDIQYGRVESEWSVAVD